MRPSTLDIFAVIGNPVRLRVLELLVEGELPASSLVAAIQRDFLISPPAVWLHLRLMRQSGLVRVRAEGVRRVYAVDPARRREVDEWLGAFATFRTERLDELVNGLARGAAEPRPAGGSLRRINKEVAQR